MQSIPIKLENTIVLSDVVSLYITVVQYGPISWTDDGNYFLSTCDVQMWVYVKVLMTITYTGRVVNFRVDLFRGILTVLQDK